MNQTGMKRVGACLLAAVLLISGCKNTEGKGTDVKNPETPMGRYVETFEKANIEPNRCSSFTRLADGSLAVFSFINGPMISHDEGASWEPWQTQWYQENREDYSYFSAAIAPDGTIFAGGLAYREETDTQDESTEEPAEKPAEESAEEGNEKTAEPVFSYTTQYQIVEPDQTVRVLECGQLKGRDITNQMLDGWYAPDGTLYVTDQEQLLEMSQEDGSMTLLCTGEAPIQQVCFSGNLLYAATKQGVLIFDRKQGKQQNADEVLDLFVTEKAAEQGGQLQYTDDSWNVYLQFGEDGRLYLVCRNGIYAHSPGGSTMEKLMEGVFSRLGDPTQAINGLLQTKDEEFLVLYQDGTGRFSYREDIPSVPEKELKVFSLRQDEVVLKAATLFMQEHTDVYVNYEVGMAQNSGQSEEDVIKQMNTELLAGNGPDVLILDGFPLDSYLEKGMLADMSDVLFAAAKKEPMYENIAEAYKKDGKICAVPVRCEFPAVIAGEELAKEGGLHALTRAALALRQKKKSGSVAGTVTPYGTMRLLALASAPAWENEDGTMNEAAVEEFLTNAKNLYEQEAAGITQQEVDEFWNMQYNTTTDGTVTEPFLTMDMGAVYAFAADRRMGIGLVRDIWGLEVMFSVQKQKEKMTCRLLPGQSEGVFFPRTIAGIASATKNRQLAESFVEQLLSAEAAGEAGFSVNKKAMEQLLLLNDAGQGEIFGTISMTSEEGYEEMLEVSQLDRENVAWFQDTMEALHTPYLIDSRLKAAVLETGERVLNSELDIPAAMEEIYRRVQLFMAG